MAGWMEPLLMSDKIYGWLSEAGIGRIGHKRRIIRECDVPPLNVVALYN
jgi:hypothetical protein